MPSRKDEKKRKGDRYGKKLPPSTRHVGCFTAQRDTQARAKSSGLLLDEAESERTGRYDAMTKDDRDLLDLLKGELAFINQGGYGRSVRTPWLPKSAFQDSLTCINYGYPYRAHPCNECHLLDFVAPNHQAEEVPCHFIPLNETGQTIEELEQQNEQARIETLLRKWLQARIGELEAQQANTTGHSGH
jgi:hypothetical protein